MGLDIYFYKTKVDTFGKSFEDVRKENEALYLETFNKAYDNAVRSLKTAEKKGEEAYNKAYYTQIKKLSKFAAYPGFTFSALGVNYAKSEKEPITYTPKPVSAFVENREDIYGRIYAKSDMYFRKVNFLFAYFSNNGSMVDDCYSIVSVSDIKDIIQRCESVLKDHNLAEKLLPTQDGFFFGSTEYDKWYFEDVRDCKKQFSAFLKRLGKHDNIFAVFSW